MTELAATPETGPVDAPASTESAIENALKELREDAPPPADALESAVAELKEEVKETEGDGQADKAPVAEESATDPTDEAEEPSEGTPESSDEADTPPADDPIVKVKVNGEDVEVPLSEALKGYSRNEDYKAKTMALADERRALEQTKATLEADVRQQYATELKQTIDLFEATDPVLATARQVDWQRLKSEDPATFVELSDSVQQRLAMIDDHRAKVAQIEQQTQAEAAQRQEAERAQRMEIAANKIVEAMPELAEEGKFQSFATDSIGTLREIGFTGDEIMEAIDDRALTLAHYARIGMEVEKARKTLPERKIVPKSQVKAMTSDASDTRASRPRLKPGASRDEALAFALKELKKE